MPFRNVRFAVLLLAVCAGPLQGAEDDDPAKQLEMQIDEARKQLDEAARKLADLHTEMWKLETSAPRSEQPMLGILLDDSGSESGLILAGITPEGGAEQAGIQAGDTIVEVNGRRLDVGNGKKPMHALHEAMSSVRIGEAVPVTYLRGDRTFTTSVVTQSRGRYMARLLEEKGPWLDTLRSIQNLEDLEALEGLETLDVLADPEAPLGNDILRAPAGLRLYQVDGALARYFGVDRGVVVLEAPERIPALRPGDVLLDIDGTAVTDPTASLKLLAASQGQIGLRVKRENRTQALKVDADALNAEQSLHLFQGERQVRVTRGADGKSALIEIVVGERD
jgi:S1-C subfamily serine protease